MAIRFQIFKVALPITARAAARSTLARSADPPFDRQVGATSFKDLKLIGHLVLGLASGLEAFSREPPCDGIGALVVRQTPETSGTAWEFLSYYPILPSRYLRDPFTIP